MPTTASRSPAGRPSASRTQRPTRTSSRRWSARPFSPLSTWSEARAIASPPSRTSSVWPAHSPYALGAALKHVVVWVGLDQPDRVALRSVDVDLERYISGVQELHDAAAVVVDQICAVGARGRLKYVAGVAERICYGDRGRAQRAVAIKSEDFDDRLGNPGSARRTVRRAREPASGEDVLSYQDVVLASVRDVSCGEPREAQNQREGGCALGHEVVHLIPPILNYGNDSPHQTVRVRNRG